MRKGYLMLLFACLFAVPAFGVKHDNYIGDNDVSSSWMHSYYSSWTPGSAPTGGAENENFYIGRVRPLKRFTNTATQVIQDGETTRRSNRGLLWWCPINESTWTSLPRYAFDSEAFSMWSYVTIYGNWTQGFLRQPGAFADVCHKNGVQTACVSAAAWAATLSSNDGGHGQNYQALIDGGYDKLLKLFCYYGIDGLGFNSEQTWNMRSDMKTLIANCQSHKTDNSGYNGLSDRLHFDFYQFASSLTTSQQSGYNWDDFFPNANGFFLNYNWSSSILSSSASAATSLGGSSYDVYAGMDMQGGTAGFHWDYINSNNVSVGIWGAHNKNMLYEGAVADGSTAKAIQNCYLRRCEQFFTGGTKNPVNDIAVSAGSCSPSSSFHGVAKLVAAKSTLSWTANDYFPFITYLNLGNGRFFNNEGVTTYDDEWYNIGMQDFMPTWRWWITTSYMGRSTSNVPSDTHASFTYDDAWFGGSCMKLTFDNSVSGWRYIQLFKTQFPIEDANYTLRVRYKALSGSANMQYTMSKEGAESTVITQAMGTMKAGTGEWQVIEKAVPTNIVGYTMAQLGMRFNNIADGTEILIGEIALVKNGVTYTPVCPTLAKTEILKVTGNGIDFKTSWNSHLDGSSTATEPAVTSCDGIGGVVIPGGDTESSTGVTRAETMSCTYSGNSSHSERYLSSISVSCNDDSSTALAATTIQSGTKKAIYWDLRGTSIVVAPGKTYTLNANWNGSWMMGYLFIDWNNDGDFTDTDEYVAYDATEDGTFQTAYSFTVPASTELGTYTLRFEVAWFDSEDEADPCGYSSIKTNGGCIADFELKVTNDTSDSDANGSEGSVTVYHPSDRNAWEPVYNDEVDTWYFEIWGQQCGGEPQLITCTTSWAAYAVEAPFDLDGAAGYRVGVRAVAPDGVTKSDIQWSSYLDASHITILEGYSVDKPVIKPDETFTVSFDDKNHSEAVSWKIYRSKDNTLMATFTGGTSFSTTLSEKGLYDLEVTYKNLNGATVTEKKRAMIQVSGEEVGAMPEIYTLDVDNNTKSITSNPTVTFDFNYTGRPSEGSTSQALRLQEQAFCFQAADLKTDGMNFGTSPFTIAFWFKIENFITDEVGLFAISSPSDTWPANNWGYIWSSLKPSSLSFCFRRESVNGQVGFDLQDFNFTPGYWYHVAIASNYDSSKGRNINIFVNGASIASDGYISNTNAGTKETFTSTNWTTDLYSWKTDNNFGIGAQLNGRSAIDGYIDEVQIWNTAKTADEILDLMEHQETIASDLMFYWDFESAAVNKKFTSTGQGNTAPGFVTKASLAGTSDGADNPDIAADENLVTPTLAAGSPFLAGSYPVNTTASWKFTGTPASKGTPTAGVSGADESGTMSVGYDTEGEYVATLTLENDYGQDSRDITVYVVDGTVDLEGNVVENLSVYPNPFTDAVILTFAKAGNYTIEVMGLDGRLLKSGTMNASACQMSRIAVEGEAGTYLVRIKQQDKVVQTLKLIKK